MLKSNPYPEWQHSRRLNVADCPTGVEYQKLVSLPHWTGMQYDKRDIRFSDPNGRKLSFFIASNTPFSTANVWIKLPKSCKEFYCFYGNPNARSESDGEKTFEFFDDFSEDSVMANSFTTGTLWAGNPYDAWGMAYIDPNDSDQLVYFYRTAPEHGVNAAGKIARAYYSISGNSWSGNGTVVYETTTTGIEDRQISGGVIGTTVFGFVTRYDTTVPGWKDIVIVKTDDNGTNWTTVDTLIPSGNQTYFQVWGHLIQADDGKWMIPWYGKDADTNTYYVKLIESTDGGETWAFGATVFSSTTVQVTESDIANIGGGKLIAYARNDAGGYMRQATSTDDGANWTDAGATNLGGSSYQWAPSIIYDSERGKLVILYTKVGQSTSCYNLSVANPNEIFSSPSLYTGVTLSSGTNTYANNGILTKIGEGKYYILYSAGYPSSTNVYGGIYNAKGKWHLVTGSSPTIANGKCTIDTNWIRTDANFSNDCAMVAYGKMSSASVKQEWGFSDKIAVGVSYDIQNAVNSVSMYATGSVLYCANNTGSGSTQVNGGSVSSNYILYEIIRNGTTDTKFLHDGTAYNSTPITTNKPTQYCYVHLLEYQNNSGYAEWDYVFVRKYVSTEPTVTFGEHAFNISPLAGSVIFSPDGAALTAEALISCGISEIKASPSASYPRIANIFSDTPEELTSYVSGLNRTGSVSCGINEIKSSPVLDFDRVASIYSSGFEVSLEMVLGSHREVIVSVQSVEEQISSQASLSAVASVSVSVPSVLTESQTVFARASSNSVPISEISTARELALSRGALHEVPAVGILIVPALTNGVTASCLVGIPKMSAGRQVVYDRQADVSVPVSDIEASLSSALSRESDVSIGSAFVRALATTEIPQHFTRDALVFVQVPEISIAYILSVGTFNSPYLVELSKSLYTYGLEKLTYLAVIRDGAIMYEITESDSDTFTATLYDTDPATLLSRLMPLTNCTVKAILKGGIHPTTIVKDCTITGTGTVSFSLVSTDTTVPGMYSIKFVVFGQSGFRKELPEKLEDVQKVRINDSTYDV